jgi:hypothetical protein
LQVQQSAAIVGPRERDELTGRCGGDSANDVGAPKNNPSPSLPVLYEGRVVVQRHERIDPAVLTRTASRPANQPRVISAEIHDDNSLIGRVDHYHSTIGQLTHGTNPNEFFGDRCV